MTSHPELLGDQLREILAQPVPEPVETALEDIDRVSAGGLRAGDLSVVGASTGMGKTAFVEQLALAVSLEHRVAFIPLEMGVGDTTLRLGAKVARCSYADFRRAGKGDRIVESELNTRDLLVHVPRPAYGEAYGVDVDDLIDYIRNSRCRVAIIDHVRHISGWIVSGKQSSHIGPTQIMQRLNTAAREIGVHIILCAQLNRTGYNVRPEMSMLQDTSSLEQLASLVLLLHRPFYHQGATRDTVTEVFVRKNRYGPMCKIHYRWVGPTMTLWPMTDAERDNLECCRPRGGRKEANA